MKKNNITIIIISFVLIVITIYFDTHYAVIDKKIYKKDVKYLRVYSLDDTRIREVNKCSEVKKMFVSRASKNSISKFINFNNLYRFDISWSSVSSIDCEKINSFAKLEILSASSNVDFNFEGFNNKTVSSIELNLCDVKKIESLSECVSLKNLILIKSTVLEDCIVKENNQYILKDSSCFTPLDNIISLSIYVDEIQDISGIIEMDSLNKFCVMKDSLSETDKKLLEDKGISVVYCDENE